MAIALCACDPSVSSVGDDDVGTETESEGSESETTVGIGEEGESGSDESSNFVPDQPNDGVVPCDPFAKDCPMGEKCVPYSTDGGGVWDANKCVPVTGDGQAGDTCTWGGIAAGTDDCDADSICWDVMEVDGQALGVCTSLCEGTANDPICGAETSCLIANEGSITLCIQTCDPLLQDCNEGLGCYWANEDFNCVFTSQDIPTGEPCGYINDCTPGNLCADASALPACMGSACCAPYCDLAAPDCAAIAGTECTTFFEEGQAPPGYEDVGICVLPG
ncbi:ribulose phosphate epimerase [Nannocystaceae bacterium ST9]